MVGQLDLDGDGGPVAEDHQRDLLAHRGQAHQVDQVAVVFDGHVIELEDDVADLKLGGCGRGIGGNAVDAGAGGPGQPDLGRHGRAEPRIQVHPQKGTRHLPGFDQLVGHVHEHVDGDGESDPLVPPRVAGDGRIDPDDLCAEVDQRAAAVAGVDGGIRLDEVLEDDAGVAQLEVAASLGADDPVGDRVAQAEGASHGQDEVADLHLAALAQPRGDQSGRLDGQHGDVGIGIVPHFARIDSAPVGQVDLDPVGRGAADDVAVGQHVVLALTADNDAGAGLFGVLAAAVLETGAVSDVGLDVDDGGPDELGHRLDHGSLLFEDLGLLLEQPVELFAFLLRDRSPALDGGLDGSLGASLPRAEDAQQEP